MSLPECRWRSDGACNSPKVIGGGQRCSESPCAIDTAAVCPGCVYANHDPADAKPLRFEACVYRGAEVRRVPCEACGGRRTEIKVFGCQAHGECTIMRRAAGVTGCCGPGCKEYATTLPVVVPMPPPLDLRPASSRAVVTVCAGDEGERLLNVSGPYMRAYAARLGADLVVLRWSGHPDWPMSAKFGICRALDHYARIAYVDADVMLRPGCVNLFDLCDADEFGACDELHYHQTDRDKTEESYLEFRKTLGFRDVPRVPWYFNAGIFVASRRHRDLLLPPTQPLKVEHSTEQHHTNAQVLDAYLSGAIKVRLLDRRANWQNWTDVGFSRAPADAILHYSGGGLIRKVRCQHMAAIAADHPLSPHTEPAPLMPGDIPATANRLWCIDLRHLRWLHAVLMSGRFRRVLEIGSYAGYSTTAFLEALKSGKVDEVHLCEPNVTPELLRRLIDHDGVRPTLHPCRAVDLLARDDAFDFVFVDGDHSRANVEAEATAIIRAGVPCVMAHDTSAAVAYQECDGPQHLKAALQKDGYLCAEDALTRPGERTDRGMLFAALDRAVYDMGVEAMRRV